MTNKTILITGVAGFIGSNLAVKLLEEGYRVIGIDNLSAGVKEQVPPDVEFHKLDIRSKEMYPLFKGVDAVYHFAALNCLIDSQEDPIASTEINVTGTVHVFLAAKEAGVRKVIYSETSAIYEGSDTMPTPETDEYPESFYAVSKYATHFYARSFKKFHDIDYVALRYFNVYGPRQDYRRSLPPVMSAFIIKLLSGEQPHIFGDGLKKRDFIYVDDVNDFHLLVLNNDQANNQTFNLGSGENYSIKHIFDMTQKLLGTNIEPIYDPPHAFEAEETLADITKAKALGWEPKVDLEKGLEISIDYIREHVLPQLRK